MVIETERLLLREMTHDDFRALYQVLADSDIIYEPISKKKGFAKEAAIAISYGCKQVDEFSDEVNEITKVFAITRDEWIKRQ